MQTKPLFLSEGETLFANKLINTALANSAEAFGKLIGQAVRLRASHLKVRPINEDLSRNISQYENIFCITSEIKGELPAYSYLVFSQADSRQIFGLYATKPNQTIDQELGEAMLKEMANILTASVVTQLSNFLGIHIYGYIPLLSSDSKQNIKDKIEHEMGESAVCMYLQTHFITPSMNIQPDFIWTFNPKMIEMIKKGVLSTEKINTLEQDFTKVQPLFIAWRKWGSLSIKSVWSFLALWRCFRFRRILFIGGLKKMMTIRCFTCLTKTPTTSRSYHYTPTYTLTPEMFSTLARFTERASP